LLHVVCFSVVIVVNAGGINNGSVSIDRHCATPSSVCSLPISAVAARNAICDCFSVGSFITLPCIARN
jgi:hypothetical protein